MQYIFRFFSEEKFENFIAKNLIFLIYLLKTLIVGTCENHLTEAILRSTHNLCFGSKIRKVGIPLHAPVLLKKVGFKGVYISRTCFPDATSLPCRQALTCLIHIYFRPTMILYKIDNIRELIGPKVNLQMVYDNPLCRLDK